MYARVADTLVVSENGSTCLFHDTNMIPRTKAEYDWALENDYVIPAFRDGEYNVEKFLDYVDVKLDWYIPSEEAFNVINFIRMSMGREPENLNSKAHYFFIDAMIGSDAIEPYYRVRNIPFYTMNDSALILSSREFSKSVLATFFILYMAYTGKKPGFGRVNLLLYVSDKMDGNVQATMRTIKGLVKKSEFLSGAFEDTHFTDSRVRLIRHPSTTKEIRAYKKAIDAGKKLDEVPYRGQRTFTLQGIGSSGGRGSRDEDLARPDGAIFDDLIANERDAFSKATLDAIESTIEADVGKSLSGNKHFKIFIGTAYHENDPIYRRAGNGAAIPVVFPRAEKAPHGDVYDSEGNFVRGPMTKDEFISVWEDRHSFENQRREYAKAEMALKNGDPLPIRKTDQEYYVRVVSATDQLIGDQYIQFGNVKHVIQNAADYLWRITTDYTTTNALSSDDSGCILWAISWDRRFYMIDMALRKKSIEEQYDDTIAMGRKALSYGATFVETAVEIDGQQAAHLYGLQKRSDEVGYDVFFAKQYDPQTGKPANWNGIKSKGSGDKLWRMKMFAPEFYRKAVIFNEQLEHTAEMSTGLTQIKMTTHSEIKAPHDDFLDCEIAGTKVLKSNGTTVNIEDLNRSDSVLTYHHVGGLTSSKIVSDIIEKESIVADYEVSSGDIISCTDNHMIMTEHGYKFACELVPGDKILRIKEWKNMDTSGQKQKMDTIIAQQESMENANHHFIDMCIGSILAYGVVETWLFTITTKILKIMNLKT